MCIVAIILTLEQAAIAAPGSTQKERQSADGVKTSWQVEWDKAVKGAKAEGKLVIYSTPGGALINEMGKTFGQKFGVNVEIVMGRGEELAERMRMEKSAGLNITDIIITGDTSFMNVMKPLGLLGSIEPLLLLPEVTDPNAWIIGTVPYMDKDRTTIGMLAQYNRFVLFNTGAVKAGEMSSYRDLVNPKWKNKIVMDDPTKTGTANNFLTALANKKIWGLEQTKDFMRQLVRQEPAFTVERRLQAEWIARGKYPLGIGTHTEAAVQLLTAGAPVAFAKMKEGSVIGTGGGGLGLAAKNPHVNASVTFVNWILGKEGHAKFVKAYGTPGARRDAPREGIPPALFPDADDVFFMYTEEDIRLRGEIAKIAGEIFGSLLR